MDSYTSKRVKKIEDMVSDVSLNVAGLLCISSGMRTPSRFVSQCILDYLSRIIVPR